MAKEVQVIKATKYLDEKDMIRVAAYCRVSTDSDDQLNSFFAQMQYYNEYIRANERMKLVDIYADEGISGTEVNKRDEFQRLMKDAKNGKIDRVLVKSVTRFARNSLECIESVRTLKSYGTNVYFENDKIDTEKMSSEMMLYIKSAFAQSESLTQSRRVATAIRMKMEEGEFCPTFAPYGYRYEEGKFILVPEEAENVKTIFRLYLSGLGANAILKYLQKNEKSDMEWGIGRITYILTNERYIGDYMMRKTYTPLQLPLRSRPNRGEVERYYYEGANEPIISKEDFEMVKRIKAKREKKFTKITGKKYFFNNKIKCRKCGWVYRKLNKSNDVLLWGCSKKGMTLDVCHAPNLKDEEIRSGFIRMYNILRNNEKVLLDDTITQLQQLKVKANSGNTAIMEIDNELNSLGEQNRAYGNMFSTGVLDQSIYLEKSDRIKKKMTELRSRRKKLLNDDEDELCIEELRKLKRILTEYPDRITSFDELLFDKIVKVLYIEQDGNMSFVLIGELELMVRR